MTDSVLPVSLADAGEPDIPALVALEQASFRTDMLAARNFRQLLRSGNCSLVVARAGAGVTGSVVGYVLVLYRANTAAARIYSIAVDARFRGRGLGEKLIAAAEQAARQKQRIAMRLEVRPDNLAALRMYEKLGYRQFAVYHGFYEDGADAFRLEKAL